MTADRVSFLRDWFGPVGRKVGNPYQDHISSPQAFLAFVEECGRRSLPCYMSVQPYESMSRLHRIERLFYDFDCAENPARAIAEAKHFSHHLERRWGCRPMLLFSGMKGCHVHAWLPPNKLVLPPGVFHRDIYRKAQELVLGDLVYFTLDLNVLGDVARISRVPYTPHEKSGRLCEPLTSPDLEQYRTRPLPLQLLLSALSEAMIRARVRKMESPRRYSYRGVRPVVQKLIDRSVAGDRLGHRERLAVAVEMLNRGYPVDRIVPVFSRQPDFDSGKTRVMVEHALRRKYKPFRLSSIEVSS